VYCPALPDDAGHALWKRDCAGTNGLLSFELGKGWSQAGAERLADALKLFGIGASWGGFASLVSATDMARARTVADWSGHGSNLRLHIGLEDAGDLIDDLARGFSALAQRAG